MPAGAASVRVGGALPPTAGVVRTWRRWSRRAFYGVLSIELSAAIIALGLLTAALPVLLSLEWWVRVAQFPSSPSLGILVTTVAMVGIFAAAALTPKALRLPAELWRQMG